MKKLLFVLLLVLTTSTVEAAETVNYNGTTILAHYEQTLYLVQDGDTLDNIAEMFITPERELKEFREGIVEINYDTVFKARIQSGEGRVVHTGDVLTIYHRKIFEDEK